MENAEEQVYLAVSNGDVEKALQLISNGTQFLNTSFIVGSILKYLNFIEGVDINKLCRSGMTILGRAAQLGLFLFVKQVGCCNGFVFKIFMLIDF